MLKFFLLFVHILVSIDYFCHQLSTDDLSSLRLVQLVHRHGDRSPLEFAPNDPFSDSKYWKSGIGQLTDKGRQRMYRLGQTLRQRYHRFLGDDYSGQQVYARTSVTKRCQESVHCLLAGAYQSKSSVSQWANGSGIEPKYWQPIPVLTFGPKSEDVVLNRDKSCKKVTQELERVYSSEEANSFVESNRKLYQYLTPIVGHPIDSIKSAQKLHSTLDIEINVGYYWSQVWTKAKEEAIVRQLYVSHIMGYRLDWVSPHVLRLRMGGLIRELILNMFRYINGRQSARKLFVYSTHDTIIAGLLHALNVFNGELVPFGSTVLLELHQNNSFGDFSVRVLYLNDTYGGIPHRMAQKNCNGLTECPIRQFFDATNHLLYDDFEKECNSLWLIISEWFTGHYWNLHKYNVLSALKRHLTCIM